MTSRVHEAPRHIRSCSFLYLRTLLEMQFDTHALLPPGGGAQPQHTVPSRSTYLEAPAATAKLGFLQRRVAQKIPFTTSKLADILDLFHIPPRTSSNQGSPNQWELVRFDRLPVKPDRPG